MLTLQKGRPYFFPNCKNQNVINKTNLQYKIVSPTRVSSRSKTERNVALNYYDMIKLSVQKTLSVQRVVKNRVILKSEFSKLFLKRKVGY